MWKTFTMSLMVLRLSGLLAVEKVVEKLCMSVDPCGSFLTVEKVFHRFSSFPHGSTGPFLKACGKKYQLYENK